MATVLIVYYDRSGNTRSMARFIAEGVEETGVDVTVKSVEEASIDELSQADGIILGSPCYYSLPAAKLLEFIEESVRCHGELDGKVGGAFSTSANIGGGNETTILSLLQALMVHGCVVQGSPVGDHFGPVSIASPDRAVQQNCRRYGKRVAELTLRLQKTPTEM